MPYSRKWQEEVNRILRDNGTGGRPLSYREAQDICDVAHSTIHDWVVSGKVPKMDTIVKFARGFGEDEQKLLAMAGYDVAEMRSPLFKSVSADDPAEEKLLEKLRALGPTRREMALRILYTTLDTLKTEGGCAGSALFAARRQRHLRESEAHEEGEELVAAR